MVHKNILIISPEPWNYIFVSKHYYAIELAQRGNVIFFLNPPGGQKDVTVTRVDFPYSIYIIDYSVNLKGQRFLPSFLSRAFDRLLFKKIENTAGYKIDIIWNFENSRFYDFRFAPTSVLKVYHQVDLNQNFHVRAAAKTADICFCTSDFIKEKLLPFNWKTFKIHHGFSGSFSKSALSLLRGENEKKTTLKKTKAFYVGNLDIPYLDIDKLILLIQQNPDVDFVFVGPYSKEKSFYTCLSPYKNVILKGQVAGKDIPEILDEADVLLLIYKAELYKEQLASPHKLMEYFASGKVIVATYTDEYKDKEELIVMSRNNSEYEKNFKKVVQNIEYYNSAELQTKRIEFAYQNSYEVQLNKIFELINQHLTNKTSY